MLGWPIRRFGLCGSLWLSGVPPLSGVEYMDMLVGDVCLFCEVNV